jgi:hypothetical protein
VGFRRDQRIQIVVFSGGSLAGLSILEDGHVGIFVYFNQFLVILYINSLFGNKVFDEGICRFQMLDELFVGVHDGEGMFGG